MSRSLKLFCKPAVVVALLSIAACSDGAIVNDAVASSQSAGTEGVQQSATQDAAAVFMLEGIEAQTWGVLPAERVCVDQSSLSRTCVEVGDPAYPNPGSLFLDVTTVAKNMGTTATELPLGTLIADYNGTAYEYSPLQRQGSGEIVVQPLSSGRVHTYYEVPVEALNDASFALAFGASEPIEFEFDTPREQSDRKEAARAQAAVEEEQRRLAEQQEEALYQKCWSLNDRDAPVVTRQEFSWYVENCSHMFLVGDYETYIKIRRSQALYGEP